MNHFLKVSFGFLIILAGERTGNSDPDFNTGKHLAGKSVSLMHIKIFNK